jgi:hypothetical protein
MALSHDSPLIFTESWTSRVLVALILVALIWNVRNSILSGRRKKQVDDETTASNIGVSR